MREDYFDWLYSLVMGRDDSYTVLCEFLDSIEFSYIHPMDGNRYEDGINMRYRYSFDTGIPKSAIARELDNQPCSVFEMMVALAVRIEEDMMETVEDGDRTGIWFKDMIKSLTLDDMTNRKFDEERAGKVVDSFLLRRYLRNGRGGLFTIQDPPDDLRKVEIWYQAMWYLNDIMKGEKV